MALRWTILALPSLVALLLGWTLAWLVYRTRPDREANRLLALNLVFGSSLFFAYSGIRLLFDTPAEAYAGLGLFCVLNLCIPLFYLLFISTLDTPHVAWLRRPAVRAALAAYTVAGLAVWFARPDLFIESIEPAAGIDTYRAQRGPLWLPVLNAIPVLVLVYGLAMALSAFRGARTPATRTSAGYAAVAFGSRDAITIGIIALYVLGPANSAVVFLVPLLGFPIVDIIHVSILAYGMLRGQLFDIDLRIRVAVERSVLGAAFVAAFFVATQIAQAFLSEAYGVLVGGAAAGLLLFALRPIQRVADGLARVTMPRVEDTAEYLAFRKCEVYREAFLEMASNGGISQKERAVLGRIQRTMALGPETVASIERDVLSGAPAGTPSATTT